jgi:hypothetical protein
MSSVRGAISSALSRVSVLLATATAPLPLSNMISPISQHVYPNESYCFSHLRPIANTGWSELTAGEVIVLYTGSGQVRRLIGTLGKIGF